MSTEESVYQLLGREAWCVPVGLMVVPIAEGRELLTGFFKTRDSHRPFRIVIHKGFHDPELGPILWRHLDFQVSHALQRCTGEINISVTGEMREAEVQPVLRMPSSRFRWVAVRSRWARCMLKRASFLKRGPERSRRTATKRAKVPTCT